MIGEDAPLGANCGRDSRHPEGPGCASDGGDVVVLGRVNTEITEPRPEQEQTESLVPARGRL